MRKITLIVLAFFASCGTASGQSTAQIQAKLSADQSRELHAWVTSMRKWRKYDEKWHNQIPKGANGALETVQQMPEVPAWLSDYCGLYAQTTEIADAREACAFLSDLTRDPIAEQIAEQTQQQRQDSEKLRKNSFFTRLHMDAMSTQPEVGNGPRLYGFVGTHVSLVDVGRVQFYGPPGVVLVSAPQSDGSRVMRIGYTWGVSVRLADYHRVTIYLNMVKCWLGSRANVDGLQGSFDMMGFSISPRRKN